MFDKMSYWDRLTSKLTISPGLIMQLDSKSANTASQTHAEIKRKSGDMED